MDYYIAEAQKEKGIITTQVNDENGPLCTVTFPNCNKSKVCQLLDNAIAVKQEIVAQNLKFHTESVKNILDELIQIQDNNDH